MRAFCRRNQLKAISMHGPVGFVYISLEPFILILKTFMSIKKKKKPTTTTKNNKRKTVKKLLFFSVFFILNMLRIPQNLRERAIGMLNAGMTTNVVAMNIGCSTRAIRNHRQRFQATGCTEDLPRSGRPRVTRRGNDRYIWSTH